jgi:Protein of unknown function with HXXEE motif
MQPTAAAAFGESLRLMPGVDMTFASFGHAWLAMSVALGLHVADEAAHDFLAWYNPMARRLRARLRPVPFPPTFTFWPWLIGLIVLTAGLLALTPLAYEGLPWLRPIGLVLGVINVGNGLLHLVGTALAGRRVPGVLSAPVLLGSALWLLYAALRLGAV